MIVTDTDAARALRTALSRGGDWAELFWERHTVVTLTLDDNKLEDAITGVDQGAGIRVTAGDRGVYANGNVNDLQLPGRAGRCYPPCPSGRKSGLVRRPGLGYDARKGDRHAPLRRLVPAFG